MTLSRAERVRFVFERAGGRCEYCRMHSALQGATFHVEHTTPTAHGGGDESDNLALACPSCNLHKSSHVTLRDPDTGATVPVFNPRTDCWSNHFAWDAEWVVGRTPVGRALVEAFDLNHPRRRMNREAEAGFDLFPPPTYPA